MRFIPAEVNSTFKHFLIKIITVNFFYDSQKKKVVISILEKELVKEKEN
jgi:hypothetical protein